jgi:hypothetical protein
MVLFRYSFWVGRLAHLAVEFWMREENTMSNDSDKQPRLVTCRCQHCDAHIEFDACGLEEGDSATVNCPHCQAETTLSIPQTSMVSAEAIPPILEPTLPQPLWFGSETSSLQIKTTSGAHFEIVSVRLFNAADLQMLASKKAAAAQKMGGLSTGLIPIGSLSSVMIAGGLIGAVDSVLSSQSAIQGRKLFQEVLKQEKQLRKLGGFFPVGIIDEIENPAPELWHVPPQPRFPNGYVHNGDDFVAVKDASGITHHICWSCVESYNYLANK